MQLSMMKAACSFLPEPTITRSNPSRSRMKVRERASKTHLLVNANFWAVSWACENGLSIACNIAAVRGQQLQFILASAAQLFLSTDGTVSRQPLASWKGRDAEMSTTGWYSAVGRPAVVHRPTALRTLAPDGLSRTAHPTSLHISSTPARLGNISHFQGSSVQLGACVGERRNPLHSLRVTYRFH